MRIHGLESAEQARNFQLDNKELEKINVWPDQSRWLADFKSRKNKLIYSIFLLNKYIYIYIIGYTLIILTIIYYFLLIISRQSHKGNMSQHCRRKWANAHFKKTIQHFTLFPKLIREMPLF